MVRVGVRVGVPYVSKEVIFKGKVNRREGRVLSSGTKSFGNAVVKRLAVGNVDRTTMLNVGQVSQGRSIHNLPVGFEYFGGQGRTNVGCGSKVAPEDQFVVKEHGDIIPEHYPVVPCKFAYVADVSSAAGHNGLWHFALGHVNGIACIGANKSFKLNAVVP